jgi:4-phospho-D-threonate 3-dehydrogenase / 4-phospho-D-erythronate 3-dehydrogenase
MMKKPIIGISLGDPSGIGPEITVKALNNPAIFERCNPVVVGDAQIIKYAIDLCKLPLKINYINEPTEAKSKFGTIDVLDLKNVDLEIFSYGKVSGMTGKASFDYIKKVIELALAKKFDGTVTGPINKEALHLAGLNFAGHTEIFAKYTNTEDYAMMLADGNFRVIHVSTHTSLSNAINRITKARVLMVIKLAQNALVELGIGKPKIAVNGLNPHAGENGLFGTEEIDHIIPAIEEAKRLGIDADGPHPPDTIFPKLKGEQYDIVVCMYHDQGHIPVKLTGFQYDKIKKRWKNMSGVHITLGLPIIRVSVDHGTAFDIAGKGIANAESMIQAIMYSANLVRPD